MDRRLRGPSLASGAALEVVFCYAVALLVTAAHLAYGANSTPLSLLFAGGWFLLLSLLLTRRDARAALERAPITAIAAAFALVLLACGLQLTPLAPGGPHPIWTFAPGAPAVASIDPYATLVEIVKLLALAAAFLVGAIVAARDDQANRLLRAILLVGAVYCAWAIFDHATEPSLLFGRPREFDPSRLSGSMGSANSAATLFGALFLLNIVDIARCYANSRPSRGFHASHLQTLLPSLARPVAACVLAFGCLVLTQSRAGIAASLAAAVALTALMLLTRRGRISPAASFGLSAAATVALVFLVFSLPLVEDRLPLLKSDSLVRGQIFSAHWAAFQHAPWSGYGLGSFRRVNAMIMNTADAPSLSTLGAAHNLYLQWLEETGLAGAAAMGLLMLATAAMLLRQAARPRRMRSWVLGVLAVLLLFAAHGTVDFALQVPSLALLLSLLLGIGVGLWPKAHPARAPAARSKRAVTPGRDATKCDADHPGVPNYTLATELIDETTWRFRRRPVAPAPAATSYACAAKITPKPLGLREYWT